MNEKSEYFISKFAFLLAYFTYIHYKIQKRTLLIVI